MNPESYKRHEHGGMSHDQHGSMAKRGVTRPQMEMESGHHEMNSDERRQMNVVHHRQTLWVWWTVILLGVWMVAAPATFGYGADPAGPAGGLTAPLSLKARVQGMIWSDVISGLLLVILGWRALTPGRPKSQWAACFVGIWLNFAPLIFWAPAAAAYLNDTLVGALVIALTILIPGMPWMVMMMKHGPTVPPGWSYNPSSWPQRAIMIGLAFAGWLVSRYLAAFQLGYIEHAWDPFFGESTRKVLTSKMSQMWPISDGGLGALSYTFEFLMGFMGGPARWRTMPWMVTIFGILVVPLGLTHIILVISQPVVVGEWCSLCLLAAMIMLPMIPLTLDEVTAMCQFLAQAKRDGKPFWRTFWMGDTVEGGGADERSPELTAPLPQLLPAMVWGMTASWPLVASALLGIWSMFAPWALGIEGTLADANQVIGALVVTVSVIVMAEVVRVGRFLNVLLGVGIAVTPWLLAGATSGAQWNNLVVGIALVLLTIPRGRIREQYGTWNRYVK